MPGYPYRTKISTKKFVENFKAMKGNKAGQIPLTRRELRFLEGSPARPKSAYLSKRRFGKDITRKEFAAKMAPVMPERRINQVIRKHLQPSPLVAQQMMRGRRPFKVRQSVAKQFRNPRVVRKLFRA